MRSTHPPQSKSPKSWDEQITRVLQILSNMSWDLQILSVHEDSQSTNYRRSPVMFDLPRYLFITVAVGDDSHYTLQIERTGNRYKVVNFQSVFRYVVNGKLVLKKRNGNGKDIGVESIVLKEKCRFWRDFSYIWSWECGLKIRKKGDDRNSRSCLGLVFVRLHCLLTKQN